MLEERIKRASKTRQVVSQGQQQPPPAPEPVERQGGGARTTSRPGTGLRPPSAASAGAARDNDSEVSLFLQVLCPNICFMCPGEDEVPAG